jgi:hypothetical protein
MPLNMPKFAQVVTVAGLALTPVIASAASASAAATAGFAPITIAIPATPVSTAGSFTLVLSPPDPCNTGVTAQPNCTDVIPGVLQIALSPPDPCDGLCPAAKDQR